MKSVIGVKRRTTSLNLGGIQHLALGHGSNYNRLCVKSNSKAQIPIDDYETYFTLGHDQILTN